MTQPQRAAPAAQDRNGTFDAVRFENATRADLPELMRFCERFLTTGEHDLTRLEDAFDTGRYLACKAMSQGKALAFMAASAGISFTYPHPALEAEIRAFAHGRRIWTFDAAVVLPEYRGRGLISGLFQQMLRQLRARGVELIISENWIYPDGHIPVIKHSERFGRIVFQREIPGFYREFPRYGLRCPICGENCVCGARILIGEITTEHTGGPES